MKWQKFATIIFASICLLSCKQKKTSLFKTIPAAESGIHFNNEIIENDSINELDIENVYNGGGVGIGDFNNDGLQDIYLSGNLVPNKLFLNKGNFKFQDITGSAGVGGESRWCRGVSVIDINNDGRPDIYICCTLKSNPGQRANLLYINQGPDKNNLPYFKEEAKAYGLDDSSHSTQAAFFDYDNDGDLDVYVAENEINKNNFPDNFHPVIRDGTNPSTGKLFRNDWSDSLDHPFYTDVSKQAGIQTEGYGHSVNIADFNNDGWKDIYVANDFITNDLLWINNHDGTFSEELSLYFKHTSANAMGADVSDINNDGLADMIVLDMNPEDNYRKKMFLNANGYQKYQNSDLYGYNYQYVRNTLQLNQGPRVGKNDSIGAPTFSEIGFYAGMAETDWSWTPMVTDFDNDGYRDLIVTNGFPKDITDHDFIVFRQQAYQIATKQHMLAQIPVVKIHNYAYKNNGNLTFSDVSDSWGLNTPNFSNGAAYVDLDNDGDLDFIINNINDDAALYQNDLSNEKKEDNHFLRLRFKGDLHNLSGIGASIEIFYDHGKKQAWENSPFRGYLSTIEDVAHFGLGKVTIVDSLLVKWPNGKMQTLKSVKANQVLTLSLSDATSPYSYLKGGVASNALFKEANDSVNIHYTHEESDFIDFNIQKLLPHKFSEYGPALAAGDLDGNGLDDIISGGSAEKSAQVFLQQHNGAFLQKSFTSMADSVKKKGEDRGLLLFDADGDGDLDLFIAGGSYESEPNSEAYRDHFYINDGKGRFREDTSAIPANFVSKFCVRAADYDKDGDLDLFIAGRVEPWHYPKPVSSFIYRNDSKDGRVIFKDVSAEVAKDLKDVGLVCDALFTDFDNDGWTDLVLAGEWMPVTFLKNNKGIFNNLEHLPGIDDRVGWWNTIAGGDFDNDGDIDYVIGNIGQNSIYKASLKYPVSIYAKDFDNNGSFDAFPSYYIPASQEDQTKKEFPAQVRDDAVKQVIGMRSKFQNYKSYAVATMDKLFSKEELKGAVIRRATEFSSCYIRNDGNGKFTMKPLPVEAQLSVLNGMLVDDFDGDGKKDILINGNDFGTEVSVGRYDALNGLLLKGNGQNDFTPLSILESGIYIPGDGKSLVRLQGRQGNYLVAASQNRGPLKVFELKKKVQTIPAGPADEYAIVKYKDGTSQKAEFYYGSSFLSQSARCLTINEQVVDVTIYTTKGQARKINIAQTP